MTNDNIIDNPNKPEMVEKDDTIHWRGIPTTETEKAANKPPKNINLPPTLQSEAFDIQ